MFKKKKKHSGKEISYDVEKYEHALQEWNKQSPKIEIVELPVSISSSIEDSFLYLYWNWDEKEISLHAVKRGDEVEEFKSRVEPYLADSLFYVFQAFLANDSATNTGVILEGFDRYYSSRPDSIKRGVILEWKDGLISFTWMDHRVEPVYCLTQLFTLEDICLFVSSTGTFVKNCNKWRSEIEEWRKEKPETWQYPPVIEDNIGYEGEI